MAKLEGELGTGLMTREAGGVRLTEAGRLLHAHAVGILEAVSEANAGLDALRADRVKRLRLTACPVAAAAIMPRALRLLRRRLPGAELVLEETAAGCRAVAAGRAEVAVWVATGTPAPDPATVETVLVREPLLVALAADHPLARLDALDAEALAATPRLGGRVRSAAALLALVAAGEGYALLPRLAAEPPPAGVALRPLAGAPEWELRAARPADDVLSVGTLAALDALRRVSAGTPPAAGSPLRHAAVSRS
jgi:DNA-binding transcriptional LysR family regulator